MILADTVRNTWPISYFETLDSTNLEASRRAQHSPIGPVWLCARQQTAGRGRLGREWVSLSGNLFCTALVPLTTMDENVPVLALTVGLAVRDLIDELTGGSENIALKWPNDVRLNQAKVSGILLESGRNAAGEHWLAIGIGINLQTAPQLPNYPSVAIRDVTARDYDASTVVERLDLILRQRLAQHIGEGKASIIEDWLAVCGLHNSSLSTTYKGKNVNGEFGGLDHQGNLILKTAGQTLFITAGDVELVKRTNDATGD